MSEKDTLISLKYRSKSAFFLKKALKTRFCGGYPMVLKNSNIMGYLNDKFLPHKNNKIPQLINKKCENPPNYQ